MWDFKSSPNHYETKHVETNPFNKFKLELEGEKSESEIAQSCLTLCDPMDCSSPGSSIHGIFQARILEWVVISFSRKPSWPRDGTWVSHVAGRLSLPSEPPGYSYLIVFSIYNNAKLQIKYKIEPVIIYIYYINIYYIM